MNTLSATCISKSFGARHIVRDLSCELLSGTTTAFVGPNGCGKSTVVKMLAGLLRPDRGSIELRLGTTIAERSEIPSYVGLVAPYLNIYDEFTPMELLALHFGLHGRDINHIDSNELFSRVGLRDRINSRVRTFSSGLRQRVVLALAVSHEPAILVLDEPSITLDDEGRAVVAQEVRHAASRGAIVLVATNDDRERELCSNVVRLG